MKTFAEQINREFVAAATPETILKLLDEWDELRAALKWSLNALDNFHPFKDGSWDLSDGLDATMYQTLTYNGDLKLALKHEENKKTLKASDERWAELTDPKETENQ